MTDGPSTAARTHTCGALREEHTGRDAVLLGWIDSIRDHGGLLCADLRDRYGVTQAVFNPESAPEAFAAAKNVRPGFVVAVAGQVVALHEMRPELPRQPGESARDYESRLRVYPSGVPAGFAIETAGGRLAEIGLAVGDRVANDAARRLGLARRVEAGKR